MLSCTSARPPTARPRSPGPRSAPRSDLPTLPAGSLHAMKSDRRLYLDADGREIVEEGDARAAFLLVGRDCEVEDDELTRLGFSAEDVAAALKRPGPAAPDGAAVPP